MPDSYKKIFENNQKWVEEKLNEDADFFKKLSAKQTPKFLYIGCADSRASAEELMGLKPGEVFVHRNVGNVINVSDLNAHSCISYAIEHLDIKHIIVCGHYNCGAVKAAMSHDDYSIMNPWLRNIKDVYRFHKNEIDAIKDEKQKNDRLVELNVKEQGINIIKMSVFQKAYAEKKSPKIHSWVFNLRTGELIDLNLNFEDLVSEMDAIYGFNFKK